MSDLMRLVVDSKEAGFHFALKSDRVQCYTPIRLEDIEPDTEVGKLRIALEALGPEEWSIIRSGLMRERQVLREAQQLPERPASNERESEGWVTSMIDGISLFYWSTVRHDVEGWLASYKKRKPDKYCSIHTVFAQPVKNGRWVETSIFYGSDGVVNPPPYIANLVGDKGHYATKEWHDINQQRREIDGYRCALCNRGASLQVHHRTYENYGNEKVEDLLTLCRRCHLAFHQKVPAYNID